VDSVWTPKRGPDNITQRMTESRPEGRRDICE
jgi:hypothetical protein